MPSWVRILIGFLLELLTLLKEPEAKTLVAHSIESIKGTPSPNAVKAAKYFRAAAVVEKVPKRLQLAVERVLKDGGAPQEEGAVEEAP